MNAETAAKTILLVDDSPQIRPLIRAILSELKWPVLEASSAQQALDIAAGHHGPIDLLLTDLSMPGMSGYELAVAMRKQRPDMKVLFMSGYGLPSSGLDGVEFIEKPFQPDPLLAKVRAMLGG